MKATTVRITPWKAGRLTLVVLLLAVILVAATSGLARPTTPVTLYVQGPSRPVVTGGPFTVYVYAENADNLGSFEFDYVFNATVATTTADDIHLADFLGSTGRNTGELRRDPDPPDPNRVIYAAYSYGFEAGPTGSGLLVTVTMTATQAGTSTLALENLQVTDINGTLVASAMQPDTVTVTDQPSFPVYLPVMLNEG